MLVVHPVVAELTAADALDVGVALAFGLLFGMQRERSHAASGQAGPAGARTFPIVALLGAASVLATGGTPSWLTAAAFLGVAGLTVVAYLRMTGDGEKKAIGLTTEMLLLLSFVLGAAAAAGMREAAAVVGAAALILVSTKQALHGLAGKLTDEDEKAFLKFVAVALLVLPFLPDKDIGPFDAVNPHDIGRMAVLVAGVSFAAYVAVKTVGADRGILVTGVLGGLVSSTATTAALARRSRESPELSARLASGAMAACAVLYPRVLVVVAFISPGFVARLAPLLAPIAGVTIAACFQGLFAAKPDAKTQVPLKNPFELKPAIVFALIYAVVVLITRAARAWLGDAGVYVVSAVAGLTDMDAISLTMARLFGSASDVTTLAKAVVIAAAANSCVKAGIAWTVGSRSYGRRVAVGLIGAAIAGVVTVVVF